MHFPLTLIHLCFQIEAQGVIRLGGYQAGSNLRGGLGTVMRRAYCPETQTKTNTLPSAEHIASCPVCWLLAANQRPGEERRGYTLLPPLKPPPVYLPGQRFTFGITLFGEAIEFLPFFLVAVPEMGRCGVGIGRGAENGKFRLTDVWAINPYGGELQKVLEEGKNMVALPKARLDHSQVIHTAGQIGAAQPTLGSITFRFYTPMRMADEERLVKAPAFGIFFNHLLKRLDDLAQQFSSAGRRPYEERLALQAAADQVTLLQTDVSWQEVESGSSRLNRSTWVSGLVGEATYAASPQNWQILLPWLLWGQAAQVGKSTVKGNGIFEMALGEHYWVWLGGDHGNNSTHRGR